MAIKPQPAIQERIFSFKWAASREPASTAIAEASTRAEADATKTVSFGFAAFAAYNQCGELRLVAELGNEDGAEDDREQLWIHRC